MQRRIFLQHIFGATGAVALGTLPFETWASPLAKEVKITILHTNDQHSRLEPFPKGDRMAGRGGVVNRARILSKIRSEEQNVLLFDAGDIFQGTPYFNFYKGRPEIELMSQMGYDAVTMGNHDFDGGLDLYVNQIKAYAKFPVLVANYDFTGTSMEGLAQPYKIFNVQGVKVGVFGIGISPDGLIPQKLFGGTKYLDPVKTANETAAMLRNEKKCSLVVCLSHLGYKMDGGEMSDLLMAPQTKDIDVIIGGHTHTFLNEPTILKNQAGKSVIINQAGWGGASLGRLDFRFDRVSKKVYFESQTVPVQ
ncbi:MAG: metallophosphatase [Bacteroidetes bacterium]|nr:metallophosphatase [Bacteroidota bacterium]